MRKMGIAGLSGLGLALIWSSGAVARGVMDTPARDCAAQPVPLPHEYEPWTTRTPIVAAKDKAGLDKAILLVGRAADATLPGTGEVRYVLRPEKPGGPVSFGGLLAFDVGQAATYRVVLGSPAWVDVLEDGKPVVSTAHRHGPDCSGIRKMVDFPLKAGRHVLQLSGNPAATATVWVARLP